MVIATSGKGSSLGYTRIISSSFSPSFSVELSESKTYRDISLSINKCLRGLFIIDKNNIIALIYDESTFISEIASLKLGSPSVKY